MGDKIPAEAFLETPQLQMSFEDRNILREQDRRLIKDLGLKFRGRNAWPMFRSWRPGYMPWFLEQDEARFLGDVLEQLLDVAPRLRENKELLPRPTLEKYLVRVPVSREGALAWEDRVVAVPPPPPTPVNISVSTNLIAHLEQMPPTPMRLEVDLFMLDMAFREEQGSRPAYPYLLLAVESQNGLILGQETLAAEPSLLEMLGNVPQRLLVLLANARVRPAEMVVRSERLFSLLEGIMQEIGVRFTLGRLKRLDRAKDALMGRFMP